MFSSIIPCGGCCGGCCTCQPCDYAVWVFNSNNCTDDDFSLSLNGLFITNIYETDKSCECPDPTGNRGHLIFNGSSVDDMPCPISNIIPVGTVIYTITTSLLDGLTACQLSFTLESISNNNCLNYGEFHVYKLCDVDSCQEYCCPVIDSTYSGYSGLCSQTYIATNPCCSSVTPMAYTPVKRPTRAYKPVKRPTRGHRPCNCKPEPIKIKTPDELKLS